MIYTWPIKTARIYTYKPWLLSQSSQLSGYNNNTEAWHRHFISALHGFVNPDTMLAPYEMALNNMNVAERKVCKVCKVWADTVRPNLPPGHLVYFAGECYRKYLPDGEVPMKSMGIGIQLQWLTNKG